jgi:hypothetical protein
MDVRNPLFRDCASYKSMHDGSQRLYWYRNGMGASVVRHKYSYGGDSQLYELGTAKYQTEQFSEDGWRLVHIPLVIEDDEVIGWLTEDQVEELLAKIKAL